MKIMTKLPPPLIVIFGFLIFADQAHSQQRQNRKRGPDVFKFLAEKYDKDKDGKLSREEYDRSEENFVRFDTNKDGELTADDWSGGRRGRRGRGGGRQKHDDSGAPKVGDQAPDFSLTHINDETKTVQLSSFAGSKPVALLFGSCTWPPFAASVGQLNSLNKKLGEQVQVFLIYTREAHAIDSTRTNFRSTVEQPITTEERRTVAQEFLTTMKLEVPALLDDIEDTASKAYVSLPDRLYLIGKDGKIAFAGDKGPRGFKIDLLQKAMEAEIEKSKPTSQAPNAADTDSSTGN